MKRVTGDYDYILIPKHKVLQEHKKTKNLLKWFLFHNVCDLNSELKKKMCKDSRNSELLHPTKFAFD